MTGVADDIDQIMAIMQAAFEPRFGEAWTYRQVLDALTVGKCHYCLIDDEGNSSSVQQAEGFYLSRHGFEEEELLLLAVKPGSRRKGLARILLEDLARSAAARGAVRLLLEMRRGNEAENLYRNFGFTPIGVRTGYYQTKHGEKLDAVTFSLFLQ